MRYCSENNKKGKQVRRLIPQAIRASVMSIDATTFSTLVPPAGSDRARSDAKFGVWIPQTLLQKKLSEKKLSQLDAAVTPMPEDVIDRIKAAWQSERSTLSSYSPKQLDAVIQHMTRIALDTGQEVDLGAALGFLENGTLKASDGIHIIVAGSTIGEEDCIFGSTASAAPEASLHAQEPTTLWTISRLLFQAVLVKQTKATDAERAEVLRAIPILAPLDPIQRGKICDALEKKQFGPGEVIVKQGEVGDALYFIKGGAVEVRQKTRGEAEAKILGTHKAGTFFGEQSIMQNDTGAGDSGSGANLRNATCVAVLPTTCYRLGREDFTRMLGPMHELIGMQSKARTLSAVSLLSELSVAEREEIARLMKRRVYAPGDIIIRQGDSGDEFFIIDSGEVRFERKKESEAAADDIGTLFANQFFGEGSLLTSDVRRASAIAVADTVCYTLSGQQFRDLFGDEVIKCMEAALEKRKAADEDEAARAATLQVEDINAITVLGEGSYGKVTLVRHETTGKTYALKQITKEHIIRMKQTHHIRTELDVLRMVNHVFVCNLIRTFKNKHSVSVYFFF